MRRKFPRMGEFRKERRRARRELSHPSFPMITGRKLKVASPEEVLPRPVLAVPPVGKSRVLKMVAAPTAPDLVSTVSTARNSQQGRILGMIAWFSVSIWWINCLFIVFSRYVFQDGSSIWSKISYPMFFVALLGSHFSSVISKSFLHTDDQLGIRAVMAFWGSILIWAPLGWVVYTMLGLFAS